MNDHNYINNNNNNVLQRVSRSLFAPVKVYSYLLCWCVRSRDAIFIKELPAYKFLIIVARYSLYRRLGGFQRRS